MAEAAGSVYGPLNAETGDESEWTAKVLSGNNTFEAEAAANNNGTYGFKHLWVDGDDLDASAYLTISPPDDWYSRFYVYIPSGWGGVAWGYVQLMSLNASTGWDELAVALFRKNATVPYTWEFRSSFYMTTITTATNFSTDAWHYIEIHFIKHASTGGWQIWVDGDSVGSQFTGDTTGKDIARVYAAGVCEFNAGGAGDYIYTDDYKGDSSYIGAYADSGSVLPMMNLYRRLRTG